MAKLGRNCSELLAADQLRPGVSVSEVHLQLLVAGAVRVLLVLDVDVDEKRDHAEKQDQASDQRQQQLDVVVVRDRLCDDLVHHEAELQLVVGQVIQPDSELH